MFGWMLSLFSMNTCQLVKLQCVTQNYDILIWCSVTVQTKVWTCVQQILDFFTLNCFLQSHGFNWALNYSEAQRRTSLVKWVTVNMSVINQLDTNYHTSQLKELFCFSQIFHPLYSFEMLFGKVFLRSVRFKVCIKVRFIDLYLLIKVCCLCSL